MARAQVERVYSVPLGGFYLSTHLGPSPLISMGPNPTDCGEEIELEKSQIYGNEIPSSVCAYSKNKLHAITYSCPSSFLTLVSLATLTPTIHSCKMKTLSQGNCPTYIFFDIFIMGSDLGIRLFPSGNFYLCLYCC